ncbi:MAG: ribbon-helix-helix domain-containing protein [Candidatus Thermoplasmatota archaeon]
MTTKTISFRAKEEQVELLDELVKNGNYTSRGELLRNLLRNIEEKELTDQVKKEIEAAREQEGRPLDEVLDS